MAPPAFLIKMAILMLTGTIVGACSRDAGTSGAGSPADGSKTVSTVVLAPSNGPDKHSTVLFEDDGCRFECQDYGHGPVKGHDDSLTPGVFVFSKSHQKWMRIERIATAGAKFGYVPREGEHVVISREMAWDFRPLARQESVEIPLMFQPNIVAMPDRVEFLPAKNTFRMVFDDQPNSPDREEVRTELYFSRHDIDAASGL